MPEAPFSYLGFADPASSWSHLAGAVLFLVYGWPLLRACRGHPRWQASLVIFIAGAVLLFSMSGVFHMLAHGGSARAVLQRLDHAAIFVFIASTFTPIHTIVFKGVWRWGMLAFIWTCAVVGVTLKSIFFESTPYALGISLYLAMGWVGLASGIAIARRFGVGFVLPLVGGAFAYTGGAVIEYLSWPHPWPGVIGPHELFHAAVLLGAAFHWTFVKRCVDRAVADVAVESGEPRSEFARAA